MSTTNHSIVSTVLILLFIFMQISLFQSCSDRKSQERPSIIASHTTGVISVKSPIRIHFQQPLIDFNDVSTSPSEKLMEISPNIKGKAIWVNQNLLEFMPSTQFKPNQNYTVKINLKAISDTLSFSYKFDFRTIKPTMNVNITKIESIEFDGKKGYCVHGTINTNDYVSTEDLSPVLKANIENISLNPTFSSESGQSHSFVIDSITGTVNSQIMTIKYDGSAIDASEKGEFTYQIPSINEFKIINHTVSYDPEPVIIINFSDILHPDQDYTGMVQLANISNLQIIADKNSLKIYPKHTDNGNFNLTIHQGIKSISDEKLAQTSTFNVNLSNLKPELRKTNAKIITPPTQQGTLFEFEATHLKAVDVRIYQVFQDNVIQFLQVNDYDESWELDRVGKRVYQSTINLEGQAESSSDGWSKYYLDLSKLIENEPGALYHIQIGFRKEHVIWNCIENLEENRTLTNDEFWNQFEDYSYDQYSWQTSDDPCNNNYYGFRKAIRHNYLSSNIGLIAKKDGKSRVTVFATSINQNKPLANCTIKALNFQQQVIETKTTDENGKVVFSGNESIYFIQAQNSNDRNYLKLQLDKKLSTSNFNVDGIEARDGIKAYIFTERDVYRPGDTVFMGFMIHDPQKTIPTTHPIHVYVTNSNGQNMFESRFQYSGEPMHRIDIPTKSDALTGRWSAHFTIGKKGFTKQFRVETIRPNRMEIIHNIPDTIDSKKFTANIFVQWLHGGSAGNQEFKTDITATPHLIKFKSYPGYIFDNPYEESYNQEWEASNVKLDQEGKINVKISIPKGLNSATYKLICAFRASEPNGQFTLSSAQTIISPYDNLTGINLPKADGQWEQYQSKKKYSGKIILTDIHGIKKSVNQKVNVKIYKRNWRWWYQSSSNDYDYMTNSSSDLISNYTANVVDGKGSFDFSITDSWGYYQIVVQNAETKQLVSTIIRVGDDGFSGERSSQDVATLDLTISKNEFLLDEMISLTFPSSEDGKALISIENGQEIIHSEWVKTTEKYTTYQIKASAKMSPNVYFNVTMLQPFAQSTNDRPLRLFGIVPCKIIDPATQLFPVLESPDKVNCNEPFTVKISERNGNKMKYMLAIVDEGLLGITSYKTPKPWGFFHSQEALGVETWDIFDHIMGAMSGFVGRVIGIGGDDGGVGSDPTALNTQFKPVVKFMGPFVLEKNKLETHKIELPAFLGAVRVMVISATNQSWGSESKRITVSSPLLLTVSTPRILTPGDNFDLPITIFGSAETKSLIKVTIKSAENLTINSKDISVNLDDKHRGSITLPCQVKSEIGQAGLVLEATDGKHNSTYEFKIPIENPTPMLYTVEQRSLEPNAHWKIGIQPIGVIGTNSAVVELSSIPPIDMEKHLQFLLNYPYGCLEQTTSTAFPLLYIGYITELDAERKEKINSIVSQTIKRIYGFQDATGVLNYWQGTSNYIEWADLYAGDFLIDAQTKGYKVDEKVLNRWISVHRKKASKWVNSGALSRLNQSYRLFVLAKSKHEDIGAMNRLRNTPNLEYQTRQFLAMAYQEQGRLKTAKALLNTESDIQEEEIWRYTFGSTIRDQSVKMMALTATEDLTGAYGIMVDLSEQLSKDNWHSTQTLGFMMRAIGTYIIRSGYAEKLEASYKINSGKEIKIKTTKPFARIVIPMQYSVNQKIDITNNSKAVLFARLQNSGKPLPSPIEAVNNTISLMANYKTMEGNSIELSNLKQGSDFIAIIKITNPGSSNNLENLALEFTVPAGIEILNPRLLGIESELNESAYTYRDYRDNKVYTFFDLRSGESKEFQFKINAAFAGEFYLPPIQCSQMYNTAITARSKSSIVKIK
ncbi:MAG: MG2 domain-containing protein [Salinivirgaceae bacterium]|nr:MG2 domain-containing protein [Salinivirgaceae bacterium]